MHLVFVVLQIDIYEDNTVIMREDKDVLKAMNFYSENYFGNPSVL